MKLLGNTKGFLGGLVGSAVGFLVLFVVIINVLYPQVVGTNTTNFSAADVAMYGIVSLMLIVALVMAAIGLARAS